MKKIILATITGIVLILLGIVFYYYQAFHPAQKVEFGITYSAKYAASLGFDSKQVYLDILDDLKPKKIRLMAYWDEIEPTQNKFDFASLDQMLIEAEKRHVDVILVVGKKQPRWPECHQPDWYNSLDQNQQQAALISMLETTVGHFKQFSAIKTWQVENEPYFLFGVACPKIPEELVKLETQTIRQADSRPIMLTDSGEQGKWNQTAKDADILGVTMYRTAHNDKWGYYKYPLGPWFYRIKAGFFEKSSGGKPIVGIELQAEPWLLSGIFHTDLDTQRSLMNPKVFKDNIEYAKKTGFSDNYLWGVEWWYWMAKKQNDWGMWGAAKDLLSGK